MRWCATEGTWHGPLYICEYYTDEIKAEIEKSQGQFRKNLTDPIWIEKQIAGGVRPFEIAVMRWMAGLNHDFN